MIIINCKFARRTLLPLFLLSLTGSMHADAAETSPRKFQDELIFGFLPITSTQRLVARFGPLVDHLAEVLGQPIRMETAPDYATFIQRTHNRRYDILFTAPHFYYLAEKTAGYKAIARVNAKELKAVIVSRKDSQLKSLQDLRGKSLATPDALAMGTVLVREMLLRHQLNPGKDIFLVETPSHNASLISTYKGATDAAGLMIPPYKRSAQNLRAAMVEIKTTRGVPHMPICVINTLSASQTRTLQQTLIGLAKTKEGKKLLKHVSWPMGFVKPGPEEYQNLGWAIQQLNIPVK